MHFRFEDLGKGISLVKTESTMGLNFQGWQKKIIKINKNKTEKSDLSTKTR